MTSALRWAAMRAILMFQKEVMDKVTRQCPQTTTFLKRKESRSGIEPRSFSLPAQRLTARPNWLTGPPSNQLSLYTDHHLTNSYLSDLNIPSNAQGHLRTNLTNTATCHHLTNRTTCRLQTNHTTSCYLTQNANNHNPPTCAWLKTKKSV